MSKCVFVRGIVSKKKRLRVEEVERIAMPILLEELEKLSPPDEVRKALVKTVIDFEEDRRLVCLVLPGKRYDESRVVVCVSVDPFSGDARVDHEFGRPK
jgi:hypothetical protein